MKRFAASLAVLTFVTPVVAQEIDARPPNRLSVAANGVRLVDVDDGGGGSINYLHYVTPSALFGVGAEHQFIADSEWTFGTLRGSWGFGNPERRTTLFGEAHYGEGDEDGRSFDYRVGVLGISQSLTSKFSIQLETREIDVDRSNGNLPRVGLTYVWSPNWVTNVAYAESVSGNLGTEITSARIDRYGRSINFFIGGATGTADPVVLNLQPGVELPVSDIDQGFIGIAKVFSRGEIQLVGDYLTSGESERISVTLNFTAYVGARSRPR